MSKQEHVRWLVCPKTLVRCAEQVRVATDREGVWVNETIVQQAGVRYGANGAWCLDGEPLIDEVELSVAERAKVRDA
jgi:hypothetical protein